jgi:hypothetical protein
MVPPRRYKIYQDISMKKQFTEVLGKKMAYLEAGASRRTGPVSVC